MLPDAWLQSAVSV